MTETKKPPRFPQLVLDELRPEQRAVACYRIASASGNLAARGYCEALADQLSPGDQILAESFATMLDITGAEDIDHFVSHSSILTPLLKKKAKLVYCATMG